MFTPFARIQVLRKEDRAAYPVSMHKYFPILGGQMNGPLARALDYAMAMFVAPTSYNSGLSRIIEEG